MFTFDPCEGLSPVQPQQVLDGLIRKAVQHNGRPAQRRGSDPDGPDRVARVVLAVAERALAIFPRLPPVNGRESNQEGLRRKRVQQFREQFGGTICATLQPVLLGGVVVQPRCTTTPPRSTGWSVEQQVSRSEEHTSELQSRLHLVC